MAETAVPQIFDRATARARLGRALRGGYESFLLDRLVADAMERLAVLTRRFDVALDLNTPTPVFARALAAGPVCGRVLRASAQSGADADVVCDEEALPFRTGSFDAVFSLMSLHGVNDLPGVLAQLRRALKADGLFFACLFGGGTLQELRDSFMQAESEMLGGASPRVAPFGDVRALGQLLQRAGFALPVADHEAVVVRYAHPLALMQDLRRMGLTNALQGRARRPLQRSLLMRACEIYMQRFADTDGKIRATFDCVWLSGWAPHESQQKPLKPGSAQMRLADVLRTDEIALPDTP
ncbi:MAG: methyltransferase domain-containing protein [Beijerinckiaceae bacterium]